MDEERKGVQEPRGVRHPSANRSVTERIGSLIPRDRLRRCAISFLVVGTMVSTGAPSSSAITIQPRNLRAHMEFLASDLLQGRAAGSPGYDIAASYVATQLEQFGLSPAGDSGTWLQKVKLIEATAVMPAATIRLQHKGTAIDLVNGEDFLSRAHYVDAKTMLTAPVSFVGYGITAPELGYDDLVDIDIRGRIVVFLNGAPPHFSPTHRAHHSFLPNKLRALSERGAVGIIRTGTQADENRVPWERTVAQSWFPAMRWVDSSEKPFEAFPELRIRFLLSHAGAHKLFAHSPVSLDQVFSNAERGKPQSFHLPVTLNATAKTDHRIVTSANVVGLLRGSDRKLQREYIVVTAHLDHLGNGWAVNGDSIYNGAIDNASGTAVMIELARHFARRNPRRSLLFVAVTAEERGYLGSDYFVRHPPVPRESIVANVNIDMPVALTDIADLVALGAEHSSLGKAALAAALAEGLALSPDPNPEEVYFVRSDQYSFVRLGIPAIQLVVGSQSRTPRVDGAALLTEFRRTRYHQPGDDISQPIHYESLATYARVNGRIIETTANAATKPAWNPGDFFGETFGNRLTHSSSASH